MMQTNRRIPAIVCLSMIVSGCANEDLFDNWNKSDGPEPIKQDMRPIDPDMRPIDMATCSSNCPFTWTEKFSGGLFLTSNASSSVWKTNAATWVFDHTTDPFNSIPTISWSICNRDTQRTALCNKGGKVEKLSFVSFGGPTAANFYSAVAYFPKSISISNLDVTLTPKLILCGTEMTDMGAMTSYCNTGSDIMNGSSELTIETVPSSTPILKFYCTSIVCGPVRQSPTTAQHVDGIRITYSKKASATNFEYLNFTLDSLTLTGTYQ